MTLLRRTPMPRATKPMAQRSAKRRAHYASDEGQEGLVYMERVKAMPCIACGRHGPSDAHHCRDRPDFDERGLYDRLPGARQKSGDRDTIPLCKPCHALFHESRAEFHRLYGRDYSYIGIVRASLENMEVDF